MLTTVRTWLSASVPAPSNGPPPGTSNWSIGTAWATRVHWPLPGLGNRTDATPDGPKPRIVRVELDTGEASVWICGTHAAVPAHLKSRTCTLPVGDTHAPPAVSQPWTATWIDPSGFTVTSLGWIERSTGAAGVPAKPWVNQPSLSPVGHSELKSPSVVG